MIFSVLHPSYLFGAGWNIVIKEIDGNSFLKVTIFTTIKRKIISRGSKGSNPIQIIYPGRI